MLNKPKVLTGEVKSFLIEFCESERYLRDKFFTAFETADRNHRKGWLIEIANFFEQIFQPEMITEYFENGWELMKNGKLIGISPQTLDQFITDYLRAGIKLKWREK